MSKMKKVLSTIGTFLLAILGAILFLNRNTPKVNDNVELDNKKKKLEDDLVRIDEELEKEVKDLGSDEVEDYWRKK